MLDNLLGSTKNSMLRKTITRFHYPSIHPQEMKLCWIGFTPRPQRRRERERERASERQRERQRESERERDRERERESGWMDLDAFNCDHGDVYSSRYPNHFTWIEFRAQDPLG